MITMRTVMAEASTVTTTTQRGSIVRRSRGPRYQARASPNNRKPRRHRQRQRRRSHFTDSIHTGCSKIVQDVLIFDADCDWFAIGLLSTEMSRYFVSSKSLPSPFLFYRSYFLSSQHSRKTHLWQHANYTRVLIIGIWGLRGASGM